MTFEAYIQNIEAKTGKTPDDFRALAKQAGLLTSELTASQFVNWLKQEHGLGHGHASALWELFVSNGWVEPKNTKHQKGQFEL